MQGGMFSGVGIYFFHIFQMKNVNKEGKIKQFGRSKLQVLIYEIMFLCFFNGNITSTRVWVQAPKQAFASFCLILLLFVPFLNVLQTKNVKKQIFNLGLECAVPKR